MTPRHPTEGPMPAHDDEDIAPPAAPPPPPPARAAPAAGPAPPGEVRFGAAGVFHTAADLQTAPGERGVVRYVTDGVQYAPPPAGLTWKPVPGEPGKYEFAGVSDPARVVTLAGLRQELADAQRGGKLAERAHPLRRRLDAAAEGLLDVAAGLHVAGWSLGLVRPDTVVLPPNGPPALVDLGFRWQGSGPPPWDSSPGRPDWVADDTPGRWLWDSAAIMRQVAAPGVPGVAPALPAEDVKTLARLFAWLLTGDAHREPREIVEPPGVWPVLRDAARGGSTLDALAAKLRRLPLSSFYDLIVLPPPPPPPVEPAKIEKPGPNWLVPAGVAALLGALGVGAYLIARPGRQEEVTTRPTDPVTAQTVPGVERPAPTPASPVEPPPPSDPEKAAAAQKEFDAAVSAKKLPEAAKALRDLHAAAPKDRPTDRGKFLDLWTKGFTAASADAQNPAKRVDAAKAFAALHDQLSPLVTAHPSADPATRKREQQCLDFIKGRLAEFGVAPSSPPQ